MRVLLLQSGDAFPLPVPAERWDLIIDFACAPAATYERWGRQAGCPVLSLQRFTEEFDELHNLRQFLQLGTGFMVDQWGMDWWDVLSLEIASQIQQFMLVHRLAKELEAGCELFSSSPHPLATALQGILGAPLTIMETRFQAVIHRARRYRDVFLHLDPSQLLQAVEDKLDTDHSFRHHFTRRPHSSGEPVVLLPSAYINVSRVALCYAELLADRQFLLVNTRSNGKLASLPPNVRATSLAPYFVPVHQEEQASLLECWQGLRKHLLTRSEEFSTAEAGISGRIPALLSWGIALRDAWGQVFESENVTACLSADESNPPSSIPLIMAKRRGLPALACHHGALDYQMGIKTNQADFYLAKGEMERDYLQRICHLAPERIVAPSASQHPRPLRGIHQDSASWLVFFTEPYQSYGWRNEEVYCDLLPRLCSLAQACGLRLLFKLHPMENIKGHRKMLRRLIPEQEGAIDVNAGPPSDELWNHIRCALTVQSSTAVECAARGIPVFLCAWLRHSYSGYVQQYARFGVGQVLESPEQIVEIPELLQRETHQLQTFSTTIASHTLADLFSGVHTLCVANTA